MVAVIGMGTVILGGVFFFCAYRAGQVRWGFAVRLGVVAAALHLVDSINELPSFRQSYETSQAVSTFLGSQAIGLVIGGVSMGLGVTVIVALGGDAADADRKAG